MQCDDFTSRHISDSNGLFGKQLFTYWPSEFVEKAPKYFIALHAYSRTHRISGKISKNA